MLYTVIYLPTNKPVEDGDFVMDSSGEVFFYRYYDHDHVKADLRCATLCLVETKYNLQKCIAEIPPHIKWVKPGMQIKGLDCTMTPQGITINCPTCGHQHK